MLIYELVPEHLRSCEILLLLPSRSILPYLYIAGGRTSSKRNVKTTLPYVKDWFTMSGIFEQTYISCFLWDPEGNARAGDIPHPDSEKNTPALLLSDSDEETSMPDLSPRQSKPQHRDDEILEEEEARRVRFSAAKIREHSVTLGDHPACCDLLPLSLDWTYGAEKVYDIDDYEAMRRSSRRRRRGRLSKLGIAERRRILENCALKTQIPSEEDPEEPSDPSLDPVMVQDFDQFDTYTETSIDDSATCDPFAVFRGADWGLFGDGVCGFSHDYPKMTVQILEN